MYGIGWHEASAQGPDTIGPATQAAAGSAAPPAVETQHTPHGNFSRRFVLTSGVLSAVAGASTAVVLHWGLSGVHPPALLSDSACSGDNLPKPPADAGLSLLVVQNPPDKNAPSLHKLLSEHYRDSVSIGEPCQPPRDGEPRKWLEAHPSARAVVFVDELEQLNNSLHVRIRVMSRGDMAPPAAKSYDLGAALQYLDQLLLESDNGVAHERERTLRTTTNIRFPREPEANQSVEQLRNVARIPSQAQNCALHLHIVDAHLFSGRPLEAAEHLAWISKKLPVASSGPDIAGGLLYRKFLVDREFARRYADDDIERMRQHQDLAMHACEDAMDLQPRGKFFPVTVAQLANMYEQRPDGELTVAKLKRLEDDLSEALTQVANSDDQTDAERSGLYMKADAERSDLYMKLDAQKDPVSKRRQKMEIEQKAPKGKVTPAPVRRRRKKPARGKKTWGSRRRNSRHGCNNMTRGSRHGFKHCQK